MTSSSQAQLGPAAEGLFEKAQRLRAAGQLSEARDAVRMVTHLSPQLEEAWLLLAELCEDLEDVKGAEQAYRKLAGLRIEPVRSQSSGELMATPTQRRVLDPQSARKLAIWAAGLFLSLVLLTGVWLKVRADAQQRVVEYPSVTDLQQNYESPTSDNNTVLPQVDGPLNNSQKGQVQSQQSGAQPTAQSQSPPSYVPTVRSPIVPNIQRPNGVPTLPDLLSNPGSSGGGISPVPPPNLASQPYPSYQGTGNYWQGPIAPWTTVQPNPANSGGRVNANTGALIPANPGATSTAPSSNGGAAASGTNLAPPRTGLAPANGGSASAGASSASAGFAKQAEAENLMRQNKRAEARTAYKMAVAELLEAKMMGNDSERVQTAIRSCQLALNLLGE